MKLAQPPERYDASHHRTVNQQIEQEDNRNRKRGTDVELGVKEKLVMRSPNGSRWSITVSNTGTISAVAL